MIRRVLPALARFRPFALAASAALSLPAEAAPDAPPAVPGGRISTLASGRYSCELPGDSGGAASAPVEQFSFRVINASSYTTGGVRGSYLRTGDRVVMTGGLLKGLQLHRLSEGFLRPVQPDGTDGEVRCIRVSRR